jgi:hypothetical protein
VHTHTCRLPWGDGPIVQHRGGPHPTPARRAHGAHAIRQQRPSAPQTWFRAIAATGTRDREPRWNLTIFKDRFGLLTPKGYTKGERVLRFEAIVYNTKQLGPRPDAGPFGQITTRLTAMVDRFMSMLDCVDVGFLPEGILDQLPAPSQVAGTRTGGIVMIIPRVRAALAPALALAVAPQGFTVAQFTAQVRAMTGQTPDGYTTRQGAYDLRKLAANSSSSSRATPAATTYPAMPRASSPRCSPSATKSSPPSSAQSAHHDAAGHPSTGPRSTAPTKPSASTYRPCSTTSTSHASRPPHRQHLVDRVPASL